MARGNEIKSKYVDEFVTEELIQEIEEKSTEQSPAEVETTGPETKNGTITKTRYVNFRDRPTQESKKVGFLEHGCKVEILERIGDFYKVRVKSPSFSETIHLNDVGYVCSEYVMEE